MEFFLGILFAIWLIGALLGLLVVLIGFGTTNDPWWHLLLIPIWFIVLPVSIWWDMRKYKKEQEARNATRGY